MNVSIDEGGSLELAKRSRGTPRLANRILKRVRDFAQVRYEGIINGEVARFALDLLEVDKMGLDLIDRKMLLMMIEKFDGKLGELMSLLKEDDLLILTADHGNDPTYTGTDHTREKVPFLAYSPSMTGYGPLPEQETFAVIGATNADNFGVSMPENTIGTSLLHLLQ